MISRKIAIAVLVLGLVGLAGYQVQRYFGSERPDSGVYREGKIKVKPRFEEYDEDELRSTGDALESALHQLVLQGLRGLEGAGRPSEAQADDIAKAYARFLVLRRTATREEYLAEHLRDPIPGLLNEDAEQAEKAWQYNSAWARHSEIPVRSIRVAPVFIRGELVGDFEQHGKRSIRALPNGKLFSAETVGGYSVYQVLIDMTVPAIDASEDFDITVGTMLINDGPGGSWAPVAVDFIGVPRGKFCYTPSL